MQFKSVYRFLLLSLLVVVALAGSVSAQDTEPLNFRVGIQRGSLFNVPELYDNLVAALNEGLGREVTVELLLFTSGPPLLEAFNSESIDVGSTGDTPPIFAQAAGVPLAYIATQLSGTGSAVIVPEDSPIQSVADLAGKKVAYARGSSSHFLTIQALGENELEYGDVESIFLQPGEARAAFDGRDVDAWTIWDPFLTIALNTADARSIFDSSELPPTRGYQLASQKFVTEHPDAVKIYLEQVQATIQWSKDNLEEYAAFLEDQTDVPADIWKAIREQRTVYDLEYISDAAIEQQQGVADVFFDLELIPEKLDIRSAVWVPEGIDIAETTIVGADE